MTYIALRVDGDDQADDLLRDIREYADHDILSPCLEHKVHTTLVVATRDGQAYTPAPSPDLTDDELMAIQYDPEKLEAATDPGVRAAAQSLDAVIDQIVRRSSRKVRR